MSVSRRLAQALGVARAGLTALGARPGGAGAIVLLYHDVTDDPENPTDQVSPARLRSQLQFALDRGVQFVPLPVLVDQVFARANVDGLVAVTFDDALVGLHRSGVEVLRDLGVPATVFVVSRRLGTTSPEWYPGSDRTMTDAELLDVVAAGVAVGSHTRTHRDLPPLDPTALDSELAGSREDLEQLVGVPVDLLAYPRGHFSSEVSVAAAAAGYRAAFTVCPGRSGPDLDVLRWPRISVGSSWGHGTLAYALARPSSSWPPSRRGAFP